MKLAIPNDAPGVVRADAFAAASGRVSRRVMVRRWLVLVERTALWAAASVGLMLTGIGMAGRGGAGMMWAGLGVVGWWAGAWLWSWWKRPGGYGAWALWDEARGGREAFAAAWWLEGKGRLTEKERCHWEEQRTELPGALLNLRRDLPLRRPDRALAAVGGMLLLALMLPDPGGVGEDNVERISSDDAGLAARSLEEALRRQQEEVELTEEEAVVLEAELAAAVGELEQGGGKSLREMMAALEARAREVEKLAARLGAEGEVWASEELTEALRRETDTADLGDAVADRAADRAAEAAGQLAEALAGATPSATTATRLQEAMERARTEAEEGDRERRVGEPVLKAADHLESGEVARAGAALQELADDMRKLAERELAQQRLEQMAQQLRDAGSRAAGSAGAMEQLAAAAEGSAGGASEAGQSVPEASARQTVPQVSQAPLQPPGLNHVQSIGEGGPASTEGESQAMQVGQANPNAVEAGENQGLPRLMAPVPGQAGEEPQDQILMGPTSDQAPDSSFTMAGSGLQAGAGTAELNAESTAGQASERQALVQAQDTGEGQSSFREVEGGAPGEEEIVRRAKDQALEFLQAQEAAMDSTILPPNRRDQIRRYFNELRRRFESEP